MKNFFMEFRKSKLSALIVVLIAGIIALGVYTYNETKKYKIASENLYNRVFYELAGNVQNVETYLAKAMISTSPEHGAETLTNVWREANLAQSNLSQLPIQTEELSTTAKFLNQVSDYSYMLSRKNIYNEELSQEDLDNLEKFHDYCLSLEVILDQLAIDMSQGVVTWSELTKGENMLFAQEVGNMSLDSFDSIEENFHEYSGLIYDGAFSEHITTSEPKMIKGEEISEETAKDIAISFISGKNIANINLNGVSANGNIPSYDFWVILENKDSLVISVSKVGGYIIYMDYNRNVENESISQEQADEIGKEFLQDKGFAKMKETYYMKQNGIVTINYAYEQNGVIIYPDLVKLKIALDNGEIMGIETTGYLNSHDDRNIETNIISVEEAKSKLNKNIEIGSESLAIIPTEFKTEVLCWEFKGKVKDSEFLVYINAQTGREEDILMIINTENGILTM